MTDIAGVPVVPFADHLRMLKWSPGEHVALVGPTGQGKTTLALELLKLRRWVVILATKPADDTLKGLRKYGYMRLAKWPPPNDTTTRVILWPKWRDPSYDRSQRRTFHEALMAIFRAGGWTVFADDTQYLSKHLGLASDLNSLWLQARAIKVSLVAATQRPRWVPVECWANSTHLYIWGTSNVDDLRALGNLTGVDAATVRQVVAQLPEFHALYVNLRRPADLHITKVGT